MAEPEIACFATVEDLQTRTERTYSGAQLARVQALLEDASVALVGFGFDPAEEDPYRLHLARQCVCNAVAFKLERDAASEAVTQLTQSAGSYSQTVGFAAASGSMRFLRQDLALLGLGTSRCRSVEASCADLGPRKWETTC